MRCGAYGPMLFLLVRRCGAYGPTFQNLLADCSLGMMGEKTYSKMKCRKSVSPNRRLSPRPRTGRAWSGAGLAVVPLDDETLRIAVRLWLHDPADAQLQYGHISDWDTSRVRNMRQLFSQATHFNQPLRWNTGNVENMEKMFENAHYFNQPLPWDTRNVRNMALMFSGARSFNQPLPLDTSKVEDMTGMFQSDFTFNQPLIRWDTSNVRAMSMMFYGARSFNQPLRWNTGNVVYMVGMFREAIAFNQRLIWDTSNVKYMHWMFMDARSFNQRLRWDTRKVQNMSRMFYNAISFNRQLRWDTSNVQEMENMFEGAPLMLVRYPGGIIPPPIDRWEQVRKQFMHDRRPRWHWQESCDVGGDVPLDVLHGWADEFGIPLHDPTTQRPKTKRALCADLARWWDAQREEQRAVSPTCHNPTGILGENVADIPPEFFYHYTHDDGLVYCDDLRSLHKHASLSRSPQNPYNRQPYSTALVEDINASYDQLRRRAVHLDDFDEDGPVNVPLSFEARFSQKLADLMTRLYHPVGSERLRGASADVWAGFLDALVDERVLSWNERAQVDAQPDLDQQKYFLVEFLARKIDNDPLQPQLAVSTTDVYNRIFGQ